MSDGIDVPINLPTESASVRAAAGVVKSLEASLAALGPAAAAGSSTAAASMRSIGAAAEAARGQVAALKAQEAARAAMPRGPARDAGEEKARAAVEAAAGRAALKEIDAARKASDAAAKASAKERAAAEKAAEKEVEAAVKARAKAEEKAAKDSAKAAKDAAKAQADASKKAASAANDARKRSAESNAAAMDAAGQAASAIVAEITAVVAVVTAVTVAFSVALVKVQGFKEATLGAFSKLLGGAKAADAAFKATIKTADEIGIGYKEALGSVNSLLAQGFKVDQAQMLVKAMADLKSVNPAANLESIVSAIGKIKATGHLQGDELNMLNEAGLSASLVYQALAKQMGKTVEEVQKMQKAGKLGADEVIKAILSGIQATTHLPIGEAAKQASSGLLGLLARIGQIPEGLLMAADASQGMGVLKDVLRNINDAFAPSTAGGKAMAAALGELGNALAGVLGPLAGAKGKSGFETFALGAAKAISMVADMIRRVTPYLPMMGKGLLGLAAIAALVMGPFIMLAALVGGAVVAIVGAIGLLVEGVSGIVDPVASFFTGVYATISTAAQTVYQTAIGIGSNLINGIIAGLQGGLPGLLGVVAQVALATTAGAKGGFKVASPSRVWRDEIGYQLPAGAAKGIEKGKPLMLRAAASTAANTNAAGRATSSITTAGPGGVVIHELHFHGMSRGDADMYEAHTRRLWTELAAA